MCCAGALCAQAPAPPAKWQHKPRASVRSAQSAPHETHLHGRSCCVPELRNTSLNEHHWHRASLCNPAGAALDTSPNLAQVRRTQDRRLYRGRFGQAREVAASMQPRSYSYAPRGTCAFPLAINYPTAVRTRTVEADDDRGGRRTKSSQRALNKHMHNTQHATHTPRRTLTSAVLPPRPQHHNTTHYNAAIGNGPSASVSTFMRSRGDRLAQRHADANMVDNTSTDSDTKTKTDNNMTLRCSIGVLKQPSLRLPGSG